MPLLKVFIPVTVNRTISNGGFFYVPTYSSRGDGESTTSEKYLRILDFRHFERFFQFSQSDRKGKKKAIYYGVNVSVVLYMVSGNT